MMGWRTFLDFVGIRAKTLLSPTRPNTLENDGTSLYYTDNAGTRVALGAAGAVGFDGINNGTNTTAAMVVGTGASLTATGTGIVGATKSAITNDTTTNATMYPTWVTANTGDLPVKVSSTKLSFNPSTGLLTSTGFSGPLTGNVTGNVSGSSGSCTGNAATVTNGVYTTDTGTVTALMLSQSTTDLGNADVTVNLSNSHAGKVTNLTIDGTLTAGTLSGTHAFSGLSSATNSTAAMVVGTGASLATSGSGTIDATSVAGTAAANLAKLNAANTFTTGLGAIDHLKGPSDQSFVVRSGAGQTMTLLGAGGIGLGQATSQVYLDSTGVSGWAANTYDLGKQGAWRDIYQNRYLIVDKTSGNGIKVDLASPDYPWHDLRGHLVARPSGAAAPALAVWRGGSVEEYSFGAGDRVDLRYHMPHDWVPGTDLFIHIHWGHHGTAISGSFVVDFYTTFAKKNSAYGAEVNTTLTVSTPNIGTIPQYSHRIDEIQLSAASPTANQIATGSLEVDALLLINLKATTIPTITGGATNLPFIFEVDLHYQSSGIGTKNKAPNFYT